MKAVSFEWDPKKAATNLRKHGITFSEATGVFADEFAVTIPDASEDEERFVTLGAGTRERILVVVYCYRGKAIRIISARAADRMERKQYEARR
jgi:uncharacterized protein